MLLKRIGIETTIDLTYTIKVIKMINILIGVFCLFSLASCGGDDDNYSTNVDIALCKGSEIILISARQHESSISFDLWPVSIRSFVATELPGYVMEEMISYTTPSDETNYLATLDNQGLLLFDKNKFFVCAQGDFVPKGGDDDDDDDGGSDGTIYIEDLPQSIAEYLSTNYPDTSIDRIELKYGKYKIDLSSGLRICFDNIGDFLGAC